MKTPDADKPLARVSRRAVSAGLLAAPALIAGWRRAAAAEPVAAGIVNTLSDVGFFVADAKGYFAEEGLDVKLTSFRAAGAMMAPLGSGELDVGAGSVTAGIFNANERAIPIRIVADKGRNAPDQSYQSILLRSALADRVKTSADFKGLRVAIPTIGSIGEQSVFNELMKAGGLTYVDCEKVFIGIADQIPAFKNGAIDATVLSEPLASVTVSQGTTIRFAPVGKVYPFQQAAVVYYGAPFATKRPDVARRFMKAYIRGVRAYTDALVDGRIAGPTADEIIAAITRHSLTKDAALIRNSVAAAVATDGQVNVDGLEKDLAFAKSLGLVPAQATVGGILDLSFAKAAAAELGPYKAPN
jgi:NitT/TauT family transport system substrate-binding protein